MSLNKYVLFLLVVGNGFLESSCAGASERELKLHAVVTTAILPQTVLDLVNHDFDMHNERELFNKRIQRAHEYVAQGVAPILVNKELLTAVIPIFFRAYCTISRQSRSSRIFAKEFWLTVSNKEYNDIGGSVAQCVERWTDEGIHIPQIIFASIGSPSVNHSGVIDQSVFAHQELAYNQACAVLWHELGHYMLGHSGSRLVVETAFKHRIQSLIDGFIAAQYAYSCASPLSTRDKAFNCVLLGITYGGCTKGWRPLLVRARMKALRQRHECEADAYGCNYNERVRDDMIINRVINFYQESLLRSYRLRNNGVLLRMVKKSLWNLDSCLAIHPATPDRISALVQSGLSKCDTAQTCDAYKSHVKRVIAETTSQLCPSKALIDALGEEHVEQCIARDKNYLDRLIDSAQPVSVQPVPKLNRGCIVL